MSTSETQLIEALHEACRIGLAFIGSAFPDHPVTDPYVKSTEAKLIALRNAHAKPDAQTRRDP